MLGNNMFAYCGNNPVISTDSTGMRTDIWPVLFGDHNQGYIHRMVQLHIIASKAVEKELYLPGVGRADIYNPDTKEIWEIKHGGNSLSMQSQRRTDAEEQAKKYVKGAGKDWCLGHANAFSGEFVLKCGSITYLISYDTPASGVILYYVKELKDQKRTVDCVYPERILLPKNDTKEVLVAIGLGFVLSFAGVNNGIADPVATIAYAY